MLQLLNYITGRLPTAEAAKLAHQSYSDDHSKSSYQWTRLGEPNNPLCIWAVTGFSSQHTIFVTRGTTGLQNWRNHNIKAIFGYKHTEHSTEAYELIDAYLNDNRCQKISFVGHSMGGHLSDILAARFFVAEHRNESVEYVKMFDANGTKTALTALLDEQLNDYLQSVKREDIIGAPNIVNLAGHHASSIKYIENNDHNGQVSTQTYENTSH